MSQITRLTVQTPECVPDQDCVVERSVPTSRMINGGNRPIGLVVSDGTQILGSRTFYANVNNPKPTASFTEPATNNTTGWALVTLTADAAPGVGGAPLAGVRFYPKSGGKDSDPYVFDHTAPYSVQVPATDIATPGGYGYVYAVAEDVEGNLTPVTYWGQPPTMEMRRRVSVGPPAEVAFSTPQVDDAAIGSTAATSGWDYAPLLRWTAKVPDVVPNIPTGEPYIKRVEVLIDGNPWLDMLYDVTSWYNQTAKPRQIDFGLFWQPAGGPTPGPHVALLRVTTSYGSVGVTERRFMVNDGVTFSPVRDAGHDVENGYVVTAGSQHRFSVTAQGKVAHAALQYWNMEDQSGSSYVDGPRGCALAGPDQVTITSRWAAPAKPGQYILTWRVQPSNDQVNTMTRTVVVQALGALSARTSTTKVRTGNRATVTGRFTRTDTGVGVAGGKVLLQWRRAKTSTWATLTTLTTDQYGRVVAHPLRRASGSYRWVSAGIRGTVSAAHSVPVAVKVIG